MIYAAVCVPQDSYSDYQTSCSQADQKRERKGGEVWEKSVILFKFWKKKKQKIYQKGVKFGISFTLQLKH